MRSPNYIRTSFKFPQEISLQFLLVGLLVLQIIFSISIILIVPESYFLIPINHSTEKIILLCVIAGILAAIGIIIISHWVSKPILELKIAAKKMANGDLEQTIAISGVSELKELAVSFNRMAKQLQASLADLIALNTDLAENERQLIQFLEALPLGVTVHDIQGSIVYYNKSVKRVTGKQIIPELATDQLTTTYEIYQAGTNQLYPTEQLPFNRALRGEVVTIEDLEIHHNGKAIPLEVSAQPIFDDRGNIIHAIVTLQDISDRKKAEKFLADYNQILETQVAERTQALEESEERFQAFMKYSPFTAFIKDETGKLIYINRQTLQHGNGIIKPLGRTSSEIFPAAVARQIEANDSNVMITGKAIEFIEEIPDAQGNLISELAIKFPLYDAKGNKFLGGIAVDISDRLRLEQELANSQTKLNDILNTATASIASFRIYQNYSWQAEFYSSGCLTVFGYNAEELIADRQLWASRVLPEDWETVVIPCFQGIFAQCNQTIEYRFLHKDNSWRWIRAVFTSRRDEQANCWIMISVDTDITERKEMEQQLKIASDELEKRVILRTSQLAETNQLLQREIQERKQAEEELRRSEELYRNLVELQTDVIVRIDLLGNVTFANRTACETFGFSVPEFIGKSIIQFAHPDELPEVFSNIELLKSMPYNLTTNEQRAFTVRGIRWLQWDIAAIRNQTGEVIELQAVGRDITERKQAEDALAASQHFIETIADTTPNLLYIFNPIQKRFIYLNQQYVKFFGRSTEEIKLSENFFTEVTHPDDVIKVIENCQKLIQAKDEEIIENEFRVRNFEGEWRWLYTRDIVFSRTVDGLPEQILGTAVDVTVAKELEVARIQAEQQIHFQASLLDAVHQAVIVTDLSGTIIYWNRYAETMYGWTVEDALGNSIIELLPTPSLQQQASEIMKQLRLGYSWSGEFWVQRRDGTIFPCIVIDSPIYNEQGELTGVIGVSIDISDRILAEEELKRTKAELEVRVSQRTAELIQANRQLQHELNQRQQAEIALQEELLERKRAEAALQQSEALFRSLSESAPIGIFKTDANGNCVYANPRCQPISGLKMAEFLDDGWMRSIHTNDLNNILSKWRETKTKQQEFSVEIRYCHRDGTVRFGRTKIAPIISKTGETIGQVGTIEDITEARAIEQMKSEFISIVSHELRTPLASIRGSLGLIAAGVLDDDTEAAKEMLEIAATEADRLVRLVNDILDLERLELNKVTLDKQWCDAHSLMQQSVQALRHLAEESRITLQLEPVSMQIWADPDRIIQTLVNLLSNAIKFSPPQSIVKLSVQEQSNQVLFQVQDCGRGIPADKLETIFGRFQQVDASDSRSKGGTGLGLAICRNIIQQHGGTIWVESSLEKGSTFYFTLPLPSE